MQRAPARAISVYLGDPARRRTRLSPPRRPPLGVTATLEHDLCCALLSACRPQAVSDLGCPLGVAFIGEYRLKRPANIRCAHRAVWWLEADTDTGSRFTHAPRHDRLLLLLERDHDHGNPGEERFVHAVHPAVG